jgi:hypothetical protein
VRDSQEFPLGEVVGIRFPARGALAWYRAGDVPAAVHTWVVAEQNGVEAVGQVVVGLGQCLSFPFDTGELPRLIREASATETPKPYRGAGQALLDSLPES